MSCPPRTRQWLFSTTTREVLLARIEDSIRRTTPTDAVIDPTKATLTMRDAAGEVLHVEDLPTDWLARTGLVLT